MKISLARLAKWILILVGIIVALCFEIRWGFRNEHTGNLPFYASPAIWITNFLSAFFWPRPIDLPVTILFCFIVALLGLFIFLARLKKWISVLVGFVAGLGFGIWWFFQNVNTNTNNHPLYVEPVIWIVDFINTLIKPQRLDMPAVVLLWFIYCACLGAFLGLLFQLSFQIIRKLKRRSRHQQL